MQMVRLDPKVTNEAPIVCQKLKYKPFKINTEKDRE